MLAARDQENISHAHQSAAAAKSLNQASNVRALHPKTPSNLKTPFRPGLNDENRYVDFKGLKTTSRGGGAEGAGARKLDKDLFVTPGPGTRRERAPLGQKTTNAKAAAFQTPAPFKQVNKNNNPNQNTIKRPSTTRRSAKSKIHVATEPIPAPVIEEQSAASDSEPDYGYAPPKVPDLADPPLEITYDQSFSVLRSKNMIKGISSLYCTSPTDENGVSIRDKEEKYRAKQVREERLRQADRAAAEAMRPMLPTDDELDSKVDEMIARVPVKSSTRMRKAQGVATVQAKSAATVLSSRTTTKLPAAATKQTAASAMKRSQPLGPSSSQPAPRPINVSNNTIGFPKAKPAPRITPQPKPTSTKTVNAKINQDNIHPKDFVQQYGQPPVGSRMHERLLRHELLGEEGQEIEAEVETSTSSAQAPLFDDGNLDELLRGDFATEGEDVFQLELAGSP